MSVATLEDPVEVLLPGVTQTQISPRDGLTFATGMRAILRQDPNVVAVGEISNTEEASIAIEACLQGAHRMISSLHTRNGVETILWLLNSGLIPSNSRKPYPASSSKDSFAKSARMYQAFQTST